MTKLKFMKSTLNYLSLVLIAVLWTACQEKESITITAKDYQDEVDKVTEIMVHDIFSPPVASRIYAYPNIAAYEIIAQSDSTYQPLAGQIKHLQAIPKNDNPNVNYPLAALVAHMDVSKSVIFSEERMETYRDSLYAVWNKQNPTQFEASKT